MKTRTISTFRAGIATFFMAAFLAGCGGSGSGSSGSGGGSSAVSGSAPSSTATPSSFGSETIIATGTATLSWSPTWERVNGDTMDLSEYGGYVIQYGQDAENLTQRIEVLDLDGFGSGNEDTSHTIENLSEGTWYFSVSILDSDRMESEPSDVVYKAI